MTVERSQSAENAASARLQESAKAREGERPPPPRENVDRFREVLRQAGQAGQDARKEFQAARQEQAGTLQGGRQADGSLAAGAADDGQRVEAVGARRDDGADGGQQALEGAELLAMMQAQSALRDGAAAPPAAPPPVNPNAFAELVERHVRQLAVGGGAGSDASDGQILLRMSDATLPGTDLLLSRTETGWVLKADTRSRGSYDAIREAAPELARRFAEKGLGQLEIDSELHG